VLDCETPGAPTYNGIRTSVADSLVEFLSSPGRHRIGVCSHIGWRGRDSQPKRSALQRAVEELGRQILDGGIGDAQVCCLYITSDQYKHTNSSEVCHAHLDDKVSVLTA
jgi:hypothetical protein